MAPKKKRAVNLTTDGVSANVPINFNGVIGDPSPFFYLKDKLKPEETSNEEMEVTEASLKRHLTDESDNESE